MLNDITTDEALTMLDILHAYLDGELSERGKQLFEYLNDIVRRVASGELVEVKRASWIENNYGDYFCSECGVVISRKGKPRHCEGCGALMDGKDDSHE